MRFLADENFNGIIFRGLQRRSPETAIIRALEVGLGGKDDPEVLEYAAQAGCILLTQDVETIPGYAYERTRSGLPMSGVIVVPQSMALSRAMEDLLTLIMCSTEEEYRDIVFFLPL
jgi:hypothetical protein